MINDKTTQPAQAVPAEHLPTADDIRELANEALDQIMEQAQVFASAWSLVGGRFDSGNAMSDAEDAKAELRTMVRSLADLAAEIVRPAAPQPEAQPPFLGFTKEQASAWLNQQRRENARLKAELAACEKRIHNQREEINRLAAPSAQAEPQRPNYRAECWPESPHNKAEQGGE